MSEIFHAKACGRESACTGCTPLLHRPADLFDQGFGNGGAPDFGFGPRRRPGPRTSISSAVDRTAPGRMRSISLTGGAGDGAVVLEEVEAPFAVR